MSFWLLGVTTGDSPRAMPRAAPLPARVREKSNARAALDEGARLLARQSGRPTPAGVAPSPGGSVASSIPAGGLFGETRRQPHIGRTWRSSSILHQKRKAKNAILCGVVPCACPRKSGSVEKPPIGLAACRPGCASLCLGDEPQAGRLMGAGGLTGATAAYSRSPPTANRQPNIDRTESRQCSDPRGEAKSSGFHQARS